MRAQLRVQDEMWKALPADVLMAWRAFSGTTILSEDKEHSLA